MEPKTPEILVDPRRRFFARSFDTLLVYSILISSVVMVARIRPFTLYGVVIPFLFIHFMLQLIIEPVMIHKWGTTPGKWLMGLTISDWDDCYPTLEIAQRRTWGVMLHGQGITIPVLEQFRSKKCLEKAREGKTLEWEYETTQTCENPRRWKEVLAAVLAVILLTGTVLSIFSSDWVPNRGDLTWMEFRRNYNVMANYYEAESSLTEEGTIVYTQTTLPAGVTDTHVTYVAENGILRSVTMTVRNTEGLMSSQDSKLLFMTLAAVKSRVNPLSTVGERMVDWMLQDPFSDAKVEAAGITITRDWEIEGFRVESGTLRSDAPDAAAVMTVTVTFGQE